MLSPSTTGRAELFHRTVFDWFGKNGRDLPWRKTKDPYAIALSEIMLQQTQVDRVIPKWRAFLLAFPTWSDLAKASTADVIRLWQGLGYNRRAVMLHRLAKAVSEGKMENGKWKMVPGELPSDIEAMKKLPGIGEYTANAIAAFAFRNPSAAPVDTNISRILQRVFPRHASDQKSMQKLAKSIAPKDVWTWNHALMDIGALHCSSRGHVWGLCPLAELHGSKELKGKSEGVSGSKPIKFELTDRYFRGRIVDALRESPMTLKKLRARSELLNLDDERFKTLIQRLVHSGIVEQSRNTVFLVGDRKMN